MNNKLNKRPLLPPRRLERAVTMAAALLVFIGGMLAVAAWKTAHPGSLTPAAEAVLPDTAPEEKINGTKSPAEDSTERINGTKSLAEDSTERINGTKSPKSPPLEGWTIVVDPGHGGYDGGARCRDSGTWEKQLNLAVALQVEKALTERGATVLMTRRTDTDLCEKERPAALTKKRQDMQNRVAVAREGGADMVLSIHMNEYRARSESGPQVFYREGCDSGRLLAGCMQEALITGLSPKKERAAMAGDYYILRLEVPSVLVECGFISNPAEEKLLLDEGYQARLAGAIAEGAVMYRCLTQEAPVPETPGV